MGLGTPRPFIPFASEPKPGRTMTAVRSLGARGAAMVSKVIGCRASPITTQPAAPSKARAIKMAFMGDFCTLKSFVYTGLPSRVLFGAGSVKQLGAELDRLGAKRALLLCTPGRAESVQAIAKGLPIAGGVNRGVMHTPLALANEAGKTATDFKADCCI